MRYFYQLLVFSMLYVLLNLAFNINFKGKFILPLSFGLQMQIVQSFLPNIYFSMADIVFDFVGICLGVVVVWIFKNYKFTKGNLWQRVK